MIPIDFVSEFVMEHFSKVKISEAGNHFLARCALCGDSKKSKSKRRFNLNYNGGNPIYHCFNCGRSGSFLLLYSEITGISIEDAKRKLYKYNPDIMKKQLSAKKKIMKEEEDRKFYHNDILKDCIGIKHEPKTRQEKLYKQHLLNFIRDRKVPSNFDVFVATKGKYECRYIIPIYENDNIVYFQARRILPKMEPKYKNPKLKKRNIVMNCDKFDEEKYIIITEGILDALMIENQGTPCLGKEISEEFIKRVLKYTKKGIIIALDNDEAGFDALNKFMNKNKYAKKLKYFRFPYKYRMEEDLNKLAIKHEINNMYDFIVNNSYSYLKMKWRKL
jgi:DNA primase